MQKCFLVSNKSTQIREYLERRSIVEVVDERRSLTELDLEHLGIVDVDKFLYIYYPSDDNDISFRSDLNVLRQLLSSAFFHASEGAFILVDSRNPMLEDLITSACRDTPMSGANLAILHHEGALTFSDVSRYLTGAIFGSQTSSSYKAVYIKEQDSEEKERYNDENSGMYIVLPTLTDHYQMYRKRVEVEAIGSSHYVRDTSSRPEVTQHFDEKHFPTIHQFNAFLVSGVPYAGLEKNVDYLVEYFKRTGLRSLVVDLCGDSELSVVSNEAHVINLSDAVHQVSFAEQVGYIRCRYNQLGYLLELIDNIIGITRYIFVCDDENYFELSSCLVPLCSTLYTNFVTHYTERALKDYLGNGYTATTLYLSKSSVYRPFDITPYKDQFIGKRVAELPLENADVVRNYDIATGGGV